MVWLAWWSICDINHCNAHNLVCLLNKRKTVFTVCLMEGMYLLMFLVKLMVNGWKLIPNMWNYFGSHNK